MHTLRLAQLVDTRRPGAAASTADIRPAPAPSDAPKARRSTKRAATPERVLLNEQALRFAEEERRKNAFMAALAHELRNTMAPLGYALDILGCGRADPEVIAETLPMAQRQLRHMSRLVNDLMDIGRAVNDRMELQQGRHTVQDMVANAVQCCAYAARQRKHVVSVEMPQAAIWVNADPVRMGQVLVNLISNAVKYTPARGRIVVSATQRRETVEICVKDNGVGLPPEDLDVVFDMFRQEEDTKTLSNGGMGIGLWLVRHLVDLHGGRVAAESDGRGMGSTFTITLPLA
jgi:signal transduction histidine kinase